MTPRDQVAGDLPLPNCPERRVGVALPAVLSERLDELVTIVEAAGERTSRKEVLGSLVLAAPTDGAALAQAVRSYRSATVRSAMIAEADFFVPRRSRPGPRPRRPRD